MRLLVAPQELKGTLTAVKAAEAMAEALRTVAPEWSLDVVPLADGGPGTVDAFHLALGGVLREATVHDPLGRPVRARWLEVPAHRLAVLEMAAASGLWRVEPHARNPLRATTFGTGELLRAALDHGCTRVLLGAGGSATHDGGAGALAALGARLFDAEGRPTDGSPGGPEVAHVQLDGLDSRLRHARLEVLTDVTAPLLGADGARLYAPQKGADDADAVQQLDVALERWARVLEPAGVSLAHQPGMGAAGGLPYGLHVCCGATVRPGFEAISEALELEARVAEADWVLTGEGRLDLQSAQGKGPYALAQLAQRVGKPCVAFVGQWARSASTPEPFHQVVTTAPDPVMPSPDTARRQLVEAVRRWALAVRTSDTPPAGV